MDNLIQKLRLGDVEEQLLRDVLRLDEVIHDLNQTYRGLLHEFDNLDQQTVLPPLKLPSGSESLSSLWQQLALEQFRGVLQRSHMDAASMRIALSRQYYPSSRRYCIPISEVHECSEYTDVMQVKEIDHFDMSRWRSEATYLLEVALCLSLPLDNVVSLSWIAL
ncbi:hypothetical protein OH77DRAFT_1157332 [Trametes cingulata]|nr:hypothetical protein OH77DRAFT_1157332 [Trametes cingulata]